MLLDLRVLTMSSSAAFSNCLVRFSDMLWRPKPSLWNESSGSALASGLSELQLMREKGSAMQGSDDSRARCGHSSLCTAG
ncbi:hypothetical protein EYF80_014566 [Liparis tanakae]|uniref:Uncharacterized protein n=1 Tax=Liparis tanakae TaxID=230148 RepID=A0A4Z2IAU9_9TELE|nr:hypothetical protein EYF80_014566 [Liparis tanakae]